MPEKTMTFEANGKGWKTDLETLNLLRQYRDTENLYMTAVVFSLGREFGRIEAL